MEPAPLKTPSSFPTSTKRRGGVWAWIGACALILVGAILLAYPFWPKVQFALTNPRPSFPYQTKLETNGQLNTAVKLSKLPVVAPKPIPSENRLVIPSIGVDMAIFEGSTEKVLDRGGIWHLPNTSDPSRGGNTVLSGHRWMYLPPSSRTLYLLDKVKIGEPAIVYWHGVEYDYRFSKSNVINPTQTDILNNTPQPQLTIFTCTPLFSTKQRLVLYGDLIS